MTDTPRCHPPTATGLFAATAVALAILLALAGGESFYSALEYRRTELLEGQGWRLLTGHLVHFNARHALLDLATFGIALVLFPGLLRGWRLPALILGAILAIDLGLLASPEMAWYAGFSGVAYGVLAGGAWTDRQTHPRVAAVVAALLAGKLVLEQGLGAPQQAEALIGGAIWVDAHLYGVLGGGITALAIGRRWNAGNGCRRD